MAKTSGLTAVTMTVFSDVLFAICNIAGGASDSYGAERENSTIYFWDVF